MRHRKWSRTKTCENCQLTKESDGHSWGYGRFCSIKCQCDFRYKEYIRKWKAGEETGGISGGYVSAYVKNYLRKEYNNKCCKCGWNKTNPFTKRIPLEVDHIDGNCSNSTESNLELLCPNCHSLTATYKGANRGNGRVSKNIYAGKDYNLVNKKKYRSNFRPA